MGHFIDGVWHSGWAKPDEAGKFERPATTFRDRLSNEPGAKFPATARRYRLYAALACPWAHRTLVMRSVRGLEDALPVTLVATKMTDDGWEFGAEDPEPLYGAKYLRELYVRADPKFTGRVTVPVLWDEATGTIVNNESREVMRMLDQELDPFAKTPGTLAPKELLPRIDEVLDAIYGPVNNGVYRAGFATTQSAYEEACRELFVSLDHWNDVLGRQRYLAGDVLTEADVAMFTTLLRFDLVYYGHFKCNLRRIADYEHLGGYLRELYQRPEFRRTCDLDAIKTHYYWSQDQVNPKRIVPLGPTLDLEAPHRRG